MYFSVLLSYFQEFGLVSYIFTQFVEGSNLGSILQNRGAFPEDEVRLILRQICTFLLQFAGVIVRTCALTRSTNMNKSCEC